MQGEKIKKLVAMTALLCLSFTACQGTTQAENRQSEAQSTEALTELQTEQTQAVESETTQMQENLTFSDLSGYTFTFSSGAGAWATQLTVESDGYFHGRYQDSDMGNTGEGYAKGTVYRSVFSGHFTDLTKTNDTVWRMTLADISYQDTVGDTRIDVYDEIRYVYTDAYGLGDTMQIYWKGTETADLSENTMSWVGLWLENAGDESTLSMPVIADAATGDAFYSYEREAPSTEATTLLEACRSSYGELEEKLQQATTQGDMNTYAERMYETADDCLNSLWILVKYNTDEQAYAAILEEERAWIDRKEATEESIRAEWGGGSGEPLAVYAELAKMTMERCETLAKYPAE